MPTKPMTGPDIQESRRDATTARRAQPQRDVAHNGREDYHKDVSRNVTDDTRSKAMRASSLVPMALWHVFVFQMLHTPGTPRPRLMCHSEVSRRGPTHGPRSTCASASRRVSGLCPEVAPLHAALETANKHEPRSPLGAARAPSVSSVACCYKDMRGGPKL